MVVLILALLFVVIPVAELYVIVQASHAIGFFDTLGLMLLVSLFGAWLVKHEGLRTLRRFQAQIDAGKVPSRELADGVCLLLAGALLIAPGFLSDIVGLLLLAPPTRALLRGFVVRRFTGRGRVVRATYGGPMYDTSARDDAPPRGELDR